MNGDGPIRDPVVPPVFTVYLIAKVHSRDKRPMIFNFPIYKQKDKNIVTINNFQHLSSYLFVWRDTYPKLNGIRGEVSLPSVKLLGPSCAYMHGLIWKKCEENYWTVHKCQ